MLLFFQVHGSVDLSASVVFVMVLCPLHRVDSLALYIASPSHPPLLAPAPPAPRHQPYLLPASDLFLLPLANCSSSASF